MNAKDDEILEVRETWKRQLDFAKVSDEDFDDLMKAGIAVDGFQFRVIAFLKRILTPMLQTLSHRETAI